MKDKVYKMSDLIIQQEELNDKTKRKLTNYFTEFFLEFDKILQEDVKLTN